MASEADVSQTGGNVHILHLELDYFFCICAFSARSLFQDLDQFEKGQVTVF